MLSTAVKKKMRNVALVLILASFTLLYLGAVTLENDIVTAAGLVVSGVTAVISWLAF
ncbi:MAG: hypothetical protein O2826_11620 [Chloroflexi bacterium]|nr:hypothetical protein [Chloroflexota bacterium]MDA1175147.1 hypothetical protein [Chloroflexota bacterium]